MMKVGVILLAGGTGTRMRSPLPKQFLHLKDKPIIQYSFDLFFSLPEVVEIVVVSPIQYRSLFRTQSAISMGFAEPGERRQDSVANGFEQLSGECSLVCVHDGVRPFISPAMVRRAFTAAAEMGAAAVGMPVKSTLKSCNHEQLVTHTLERALIWEIQTPQVIEKSLLKHGLDYVQQHGITVTDDVSMIELLKHPVKLVEGGYDNIKITTPDDLVLSEYILHAKQL